MFYYICGGGGWVLDKSWMLLPTRPQRYCAPASLVFLFLTVHLFALNLFALKFVIIFSFLTQQVNLCFGNKVNEGIYVYKGPKDDRNRFILMYLSGFFDITSRINDAREKEKKVLND